MMSDAIRITTNGSAFNARFERYLQRRIATSRQSAAAVIRQQAKGLVKNAFKYTPPMAARSFARGFAASRRAIKSSVRLATQVKSEEPLRRALDRARTTARRDAIQQILAQLTVSPSARAQQIRRNQLPNKHYPQDGEKFLVTPATRKAIVELFEKRIGVTAAGWCAAANALGVQYPDWISRFQSKNAGTVEFRSSGNTVQFRARNPNRHTDSATIQRALDAAYWAQSEAMRRQLIQSISVGAVRRGDVF